MNSSTYQIEKATKNIAKMCSVANDFDAINVVERVNEKWAKLGEYACKFMLMFNIDTGKLQTNELDGMPYGQVCIKVNNLLHAEICQFVFDEMCESVYSAVTDQLDASEKLRGHLANG